MKIIPKEFRVREGEKVKLKQWPTKGRPFYQSKEDYQKILASHIKEMSALQSLLYACNRYALLLIFQAMDTAGKDGAIKHVMSGVNPQGVEVYSFKSPSAEELNHDYLWRCMKHVPERGRIGIFNRSYYEETLVVRVHPEFLAGEKLPPELVTKSIWKDRFRDIRSFERYLTRNGIAVRKFFLHVSKKEQKKRFIERVQNPDKNWKYSASDMKERQFWNQYMDAYENMIRQTASKNAPWFVVPADNKWFTRVVVAAAVIDALASMNLSYPKVSEEKLKELDAVKRELTEK